MANIHLLNQLVYSNTAEIHLRAGAMNQYVRELQTLLHELGYDRELMWQIYGADGYYGDGTINAVRAFASRNGIPCLRMSLMKLTITMPFCTAVPISAMKPTDAGTDK